MKIDSKIMMNVKDVLKKFGSKYVTDDDGIKISTVINDLNAFNNELMTELFNNKLIYDNYVEKINDTDVFKLNQFTEMFEYKSFWEDSYTRFANRIGLVSDDKFISDSSDVVLDFPFKDCVLKGESRTEDDKDDKEPFLNETIAKPEINELFEPKVLKSATRYDKLGQHEISKFDENDNLIIKGNNLIALHSMKHRYAGKIKLIYLDPPYNTGKDSFEYNDRFAHSTWLTFMKNRLEIAKEMLTPDGSIWISIDSHESHYLKVLADSVLGRENFVDEITWQRAYAPVNLKKTVSRSTDSILIYANHFDDEFTFNKLPRSAEANSRYKNPDNDPRGPWQSSDISVGPAVKENIYEISSPSGRKILPPSGRSWLYSKSRLKELIKDNRIWFGKDGNNVPRTKRFLSEVNGGVVSQTLWTYQEVGHNQDAKREIKKLFGNSAFGTPKPEKLLQRIITMATDENDIVLDFFMGSATTQAVAMKMKRRFIGIEQMDYINTVSVPRLQKVIEGEQGGISKDVDWHGDGSFIYAELMNKNRGFIDEVSQAQSTYDLDAVFDRMKQNADLDFKVDLAKYEVEKAGKSMDELKRALIDMIDKNQLYYNEANIDDSNVKDLISESDYHFNKSFYGKEL